MRTKRQVLEALIEAWCERQDIDAVLSHLTEDVVWHYSAVTHPPKIGHAGAREFLTGYKARVRNPFWRIFNIAETENALFFEGADEFDTPDGKHVAIPYMGTLEFEGERIKAWRDYFTPAIAEQALEGIAPADHVRALLDRPALPGLGGRS
jgi:limonene-1,2-epoxide hydrolase